MTQRKTLLKKHRLFIFICAVCFLLFACNLTDQLQQVSTITFVTSTIGPAPALPTITEATNATLTPLPQQIFAMTQDALITPDTHRRVEIVTQTYTPLIIPTETLTPSWTPLPATQSAEPSATRTPKPLCRPEYPDFCVPYNRTKNCKDWNNLGYYNFTVLQPDPLHYDKDFDGLGCEG